MSLDADCGQFQSSISRELYMDLRGIHGGNHGDNVECLPRDLEIRILGERIRDKVKHWSQNNYTIGWLLHVTHYINMQ